MGFLQNKKHLYVARSLSSRSATSQESAATSRLAAPPDSPRKSESESESKSKSRSSSRSRSK